MKRSRKWAWLAVLLGVLCLFGCRQREQETEPPVAAQTNAPTEKQTERPTEKVTEKPTEKETETEKKTTAKKTTVKPSTTGSAAGNKTTTGTTNTAGTTTNTSAYPTQQCPYCYQQISTAPDGNGSTIYDTHVAQEKNWADMYGYGDQPPVSQQTEAATEAAQQTEAYDDSRQCGYCYQWFSVSDGSYAAHLQQENQELGLPEGTEYKICPICGNSYPVGSLYDNHVCITD